MPHSQSFKAERHSRHRQQPELTHVEREPGPPPWAVQIARVHVAPSTVALAVKPQVLVAGASQ